MRLCSRNPSLYAALVVIFVAQGRGIAGSPAAYGGIDDSLQASPIAACLRDLPPRFGNEPETGPMRGSTYQRKRAGRAVVAAVRSTHTVAQQ